MLTRTDVFIYSVNDSNERSVGFISVFQRLLL